MVKSKIHGESDCTKTAYSLFANADKKKSPYLYFVKEYKTKLPQSNHRPSKKLISEI